jgi:hypothetical protein
MTNPAIPARAVFFLAHANENQGAGEWQFQSLRIGAQFDPQSVSICFHGRPGTVHICENRDNERSNA